MTLILAGCGTSAPPHDERAPAETASPETYLIDVTAARRIDFVHDVGAVGRYFMPEIMGAGCAMFDYDGDGRLDLYFVNGGSLRGETVLGDVRDRLYRQEGDGRFVDVTEESGLNNTGYGMGVAVADIDNDGDRDLYVTNYGADRLWQNNGDGTFTDITESSGISNQRWGASAAFFDYDRDGRLDLFVVNYLDYFPGSDCEDRSGRRDYCGPESFQGTVDKFYRNLGPPHPGEPVRFADVTVESGIASQPGPGLGVVCRDFNDDGLLDIYVANDMAPNRLWLQQPGGTFHDEAAYRGVSHNRLGQAEAGMGLACGDVNADGRFDLLATHLRGETNTLYLDRGDGHFADETAGSGLGPPSLSMTGFGVVLIDLEHDGDLDAIVVNGRVKRAPPRPGVALDDYWNDYADPNQIFLNNGSGHFQEPAFDTGHFVRRIEVSRGLAYGDIDNDGDLDLLVSNCGGPARLYLNETPKKGHWLLLSVQIPRWKRDAIGARVAVVTKDRTILREVMAASSYLTSHDPRVHIGLGPEDEYRAIEVHWPDGTRERFPGGKADRFLTLNQGEGEPSGERTGP